MIAVLTGDIVSSRSVPDKGKWLRRLKDIIEKKPGFKKPPKWGVFRGDGFQIELIDPSKALRLAILIRAGLRSMKMSSKVKIDARIAIGIDEKGYSGKSVHDSDGPAYLLSGTSLDALKKENHNLDVYAPILDIDEKLLYTALRLGSALMDQWTFAEAEVVFLLMSEDKTQSQMAKKLNISQPAVHKRLLAARFDVLYDLIEWFEDTIPDAIEERQDLLKKPKK